MNVQTLKALTWLGALATGGTLAWNVADFLRHRPELQQFVEGGVIERCAGLGFLFLLGFQFVAECHQLVDFGDDALLFSVRR